MQLEDYFTFLAPDDIRLKGHRIGIESVLYEHIHRAQTPEQIAQTYPTLTSGRSLRHHPLLPAQQRRRHRLPRRLAELLPSGGGGAGRNPSPAIVRLRKIKEERERAAHAEASAREAVVEVVRAA